jgi:hypothetical protein
MALDTTELTIDDEGNPEQSTGLARRLYDRMIARYELGEESTPNAQRQLAALCNDIALAIVDEFTENAEVRVTTSDAGLQRLPATLAEDEPTKAPGETKVLRIV